MGRAFYIDRRGRPGIIDKDKIIELRKKGLSYGKIAVELDCSKTYVIKICKAEEEGK